MARSTLEVTDDDFRAPNEHRGLKRPRRINVGMVLFGVAMFAIPALVFFAMNDKGPKKVTQEEEPRRESVPGNWIGFDQRRESELPVQLNIPVIPQPEPAPIVVPSAPEEVPADPRDLRYSTGTGVIEIKGYLAGAPPSRSGGVGGYGAQGGFPGYGQTPYGYDQYGGSGGSWQQGQPFGHSAAFGAPPPSLGEGSSPVGDRGQGYGRDGIDPGNISEITATVYPKTLSGNVDRLLEGTSAQAILVTPITTMIPGGIVKARITQAVQTFPGGKDLLKPHDLVLGKVPQGATHQLGLNRIPVKWHRIIRYKENGDIVDIPINSGAADALGRPGILANRNVHFMEKFGFALMFSVIDATVSNVNATGADNEDDSAEEWRTGLADSFGSTAKRSLRELDMTRTDLSTSRAQLITIQTAVDVLFGPEQIIGRDAQ